jgi:hypothetical protein
VVSVRASVRGCQCAIHFAVSQMFPRPFFPSRSNNMLYPRENRTEKKLMYVCRRCGYEQEAENPVVFKHELVKSAK